MSGGARKGADTDQLGGRLAPEDFAAVCYFRVKVMATEKENNDSRSGIKVAEADVYEGAGVSLHSVPFQVKR